MSACNIRINAIAQDLLKKKVSSAAGGKIMIATSDIKNAQMAQKVEN